VDESAHHALGPVRNPVLLHRVRLFSLVPLVWESNPKLQGAWCKTHHQADRGSDPNHQVEMESLQFVGCSWFIGLIGLGFGFTQTKSISNEMCASVTLPRLL